jgi:N-methylhydantoinase B
LSQAIPDQVNASNYGANVHYVGGTNTKTGQYFVFGDLSPGGWGATSRNDGMNARYNRNGNCMDLTPEIAELFFPVRCLRRELITDSGGPGKNRGGLGTRQTWQILDSDDAAVSQMMTRTKSGAPGLNGGYPGSCGRSFLNYGTEGQRVIGGWDSENCWQMSLFSNFQLNRGDAYTAECPGGGGWGDPLDRDPDAVLEDIRDGFVSPENARLEYGVVLLQDGDRIDLAATGQLRQKLKSARPDPANP